MYKIRQQNKWVQSYIAIRYEKNFRKIFIHFTLQSVVVVKGVLVEGDGQGGACGSGCF